MMKFAFFDFDDTLAKGDSILPYLNFCIREGLAPRSLLLKAGFAYLKWRINPNCVARVKETSLAFIKGRTQEEMDAVSRRFFQDYMQTNLYADGFQELQRLKQQGYTIVVVSASADVYMRILPEFLPVDEVISTACQTDASGCYTGKLEQNCKGEEKVKQIHAWLAAHGLEADWAQCRGYGDSPSDAPMLRQTGHPVLVNPKKKLAALLPEAERRQWH